MQTRSEDVVARDVNMVVSIHKRLKSLQAQVDFFHNLHLALQTLLKLQPCYTMFKHASITSLLVWVVLRLPIVSCLPTSPRSSCSRASFTLVSNNGSGIWPYREYKSSNATPPDFQIEQNGKPLAPGLIFINPQNAGPTLGEHINGTMIITSDGDLVWNGPNTSTSNFRTAMLNGKPVISFWKGSGNAASDGEDGHGYGQVEILDTSYKTIHTICPKVNILTPPGVDSCVADVHESFITSNNTMYVEYMLQSAIADLAAASSPSTILLQRISLQ